MSRMESDQEDLEALEVQAAISLSLAEDDDPALEEAERVMLAMAMSLAGQEEHVDFHTADDDMEQARLAVPMSAAPFHGVEGFERNVHPNDDEDEMLSLAVAMSLAAVSEEDEDDHSGWSDPVFECQCCSEEACPLAEVCTCEGDCMFCRDCVRRGAEVAVGEGKTGVTCFAGCGRNIGDSVLREVLSPPVFRQLQQRRQAEEVEAAGLEDLEKCPACSFAVIMTDTQFTVLVCGNPDCRKETCRLCGEVT